ncbi:MAG: hypothetical protein M3X11_12715 [Acidobacteriota bacterium]|nr:hypothetical protein [Acidobacteriota bacterium]
MIKRLMTIFLLLALTANLLAVIPPHAGGEGGCSDDCCASAHQDMQESSPAVLCCILNCEQNAETSQTPAIAIGTQQNQNFPSPGFVCTAKSISNIQRARFPSSPTRHIAGSSTRYIENNTFLI